MISGPQLRLLAFSALAAVTLPIGPLCAQDSAPVADSIALPIIVRASSSTQHVSADQFLAAFITTAARLNGPKFVAAVGTASKMRPDLASKVVVCALNIARLNSHSPAGQLSFAVIDQIIKAAIVAAPQSASDIVRAAISSEPYARASIVAAAVAAAPGEEAEIHVAASESSPMSIFASAITATLNPVNSGGLGDVNSPEQPPVAP